MENSPEEDNAEGLGAELFQMLAPNIDYFNYRLVILAKRGVKYIS